MIMKFMMTSLALGLLAVPAAAQEPVVALDRTFPIGSDFCFARRYDAAHLAAHPRQTIRTITVMGRNAHRTAANPGATAEERTVSGFNVRASLRITFRDGVTREWPGTCHEDDARAGYDVVCRFIPPRNADMLEFALRLKRDGTEIQSMTDTDISDFRAMRDDPAPGVRSDDKAFALSARKPATCIYSTRYWTTKGATGALEAALP